MPELTYGQDVVATKRSSSLGLGHEYDMRLGPIISWDIEIYASFLEEIEKRNGCRVTNAIMEGYVTFDKPITAEVLDVAYKKYLEKTLVE